SFEQFGVNRLPDGRIVVPMWSAEQTLVDALEAIWKNLFFFAEDFIAMFLFFRHRPGLALFRDPRRELTPDSPWEVTTEAAMARHVATPSAEEPRGGGT